MSHLKKGERPKCKIHEVGKSYLRAWKDENLPNKGIWYFDLETQVIEPRSNKATFAIQNYLYVPKIDGMRIDSVEDWLSVSEDALAKFIRRIDVRDFETPISENELVKVELGLLSLSYRSGYEFRTLEKQLQCDNAMREQMGIKDESMIHRVVVENMINVIELQRKQYCGGNISVVFDCKYPLLVCDRPGFDADVRGYPFNVIPLKPDAVIMLEKPDPVRIGKLRWIKHDGNPEFVQMVNDMTVKRARKWIVASSQEQLEILRDQVTPEQIKERKAKDNVTFKPLDETTKNRFWSLLNTKIIS